MNRKALAVAVGALFAAPAAHAQITFGNEQIGTLQIYGKLYPQFGWASYANSTQPGTAVATYQGGGIGTAASPLTNTIPAGPTIEEPLARQTVNVGNSYIGFRGERGLGNMMGGMKAIWQLETQTNFDVGTGTWASRDSFVGLTGPSMGTVRLGNMDTVYKSYGDTFQMFGISSGNFTSASNVLSQGVTGSSSQARFHERRTNSIMYETPTFSGITAGIMYGPDEAKTNSRNAALWSYGIKYDSERYYVSVHQEKHYDFFGMSNSIANANLRNNGSAAARSTDTATRLSAEFRLRQVRLTFDIAKLEYEETNQVLTAASPVKMAKYEHTNMAIGAEFGTGPWRFAGQYVVAGEGTCSFATLAGNTSTCSAAGLQSKLWTLGTRYRFDRQTFVYAIYAHLDNGVSAAYNNSAPVAPNIGTDIDQFALGISYSF
ncbi:MAG: porin [Betaproteobacteria bacterium]|nr:porin [Betaproteobacteria bacterium]MBV9362041.1 porin [Betaproteobacteria bacterium]